MSIVRGALCAAMLALMGGLSCNDGTGPAAGSLRIDLTTPNAGADGAIAFVVTGPTAPTGVTAAAGLRVFYDTLGTNTKVVVTGTLSTGTIIRLGVADVNQVGQYAVVVQQVAAANYQLRSVAGYSLSVTK